MKGTAAIATKLAGAVIWTLSIATLLGGGVVAALGALHVARHSCEANFSVSSTCTAGSTTVYRYEHGALVASIAVAMLIAALAGFKIARSIQFWPAVRAILLTGARREVGWGLIAAGLALCGFVPLAALAKGVTCDDYPWFGFSRPSGCTGRASSASIAYLVIAGAVGIGLIVVGMKLGEFIKEQAPPVVWTWWEAVLVRSDPPRAIISGPGGADWGTTDEGEGGHVRRLFSQDSNNPAGRQGFTTITARKRGYADAIHRLDLTFPYYDENSAWNNPTVVTLLLEPEELADE